MYGTNVWATEIPSSESADRVRGKYSEVGNPANPRPFCSLPGVTVTKVPLGNLCACRTARKINVPTTSQSSSCRFLGSNGAEQSKLGQLDGEEQ
jgi:hypothetical protein